MGKLRLPVNSGGLFNLIIFHAMEYINRIELRGRVGRSDIQDFGTSRLCRFSLATEYGYKDRGGNPVIDTTWFNVSFWDSKGNTDFSGIEKGAIVQVIGRMRSYKYADSDGMERSSWDIQAKRVQLCSLTQEDDQLIPQNNLS